MRIGALQRLNKQLLQNIANSMKSDKNTPTTFEASPEIPTPVDDQFVADGFGHRADDDHGPWELALQLFHALVRVEVV